MKVHNLTIDSSQRDANVWSYANNYTVTLENPIYDVSEIKLVSARIPTTQLSTCVTNKTFSVDGNVFTLYETNYSNGYTLAEDLETILAPPSSNVSSVVYDEDTHSLNFSNLGTSNAFTFEFYTGTDGYSNTTSSVTTPHQVLGFGSLDYSSNANGEITSGAINLNGPNSLIVKISAGSVDFTQDVYISTPFYTGHILTDGSDFINFSGSDDPVTHHFNSGPQKYIKDIHVDFFYMSHGRLIPYDFRNQDHIMKFEVKCSTDKLEGLPKVPLDEVVEKNEEGDEEESISIPELKNVYRWEWQIMMIAVIGLFLMYLMSKKPLKS